MAWPPRGRRRKSLEETAMNEEATKIDSIEEFTVFALDRSVAGIDELIGQSSDCAHALESGEAGAFTQLADLAANLRDFDVFENDICSLFQLDRAAIAGNGDNLEAAQICFKEALANIGALLEQGDMRELEGLLRENLVGALGRIRDLMPALREHIYHEYILAGNC